MEAADLLQRSLALAVALAAPLVGAAVFAGAVNAALRSFLGLEDRVVWLVVRATVVITAGVMIYGSVAGEIQDLTHAAWAGLADAGRTGT